MFEDNINFEDNNSGEVKENPCRFKQVCHSCKKVEEGDRPTMCIEIQCADFNLCPGCGLNKTLHETLNGSQKLCKTCIRNTNAPDIIRKIVSQETKNRDKGKATVAGVSSGNSHATSSDNVDYQRKVTITPPGISPPELSEDEKEYYQRRWLEFSGYYRNPAAYFVCHMLILEEIHLAYLNTKMLMTRGELNSEYTNARKAAVVMLRSLHEQLPEKEADEIMDDEKSLAMIYESYTKEVKARRVGRVSRVLRTDTIALAPSLPFHLDPKLLLERCGYRTVDIEEVINNIEVAVSKSHTEGRNDLKNKSIKDLAPDELLQFFGFRVKEEFAMPHDTPEIDDELFEELTDE